MLEFKDFKNHIVTNQIASHCGKGVNISLSVDVNITSGRILYTVKDKNEQILVTADLMEAVEMYNQLDK